MLWPSITPPVLFGVIDADDDHQTNDGLIIVQRAVSPCEPRTSAESAANSVRPQGAPRTRRLTGS